MEYHVMNVIYICWKFQYDLIFIYEAMCLFLYTLISVVKCML